MSRVKSNRPGLRGRMRLPPWRFKKTEKSQWVKVKKKKPGSIFRLLSRNSGRSRPRASKLRRQQTPEDIGDAVVYPFTSAVYSISWAPDVANRLQSRAWLIWLAGRAARIALSHPQSAAQNSDAVRRRQRVELHSRAKRLRDLGN